MDNPDKSLLSSKEEQVLINKEMLIVNSLALAEAVRILAAKSEFPFEMMMCYLADKAIKEYKRMPPEERENFVKQAQIFTPFIKEMPDELV